MSTAEIAAHEFTRSYLYVPGHRPDLFDKALRGDADAIVVDLEDSVPASAKRQARRAAASLLSQPHAKPVWVRTSGPASGAFEQDLEAIATPHLAGIRIPKAERATDLTKAAEVLRASGAFQALLVPLLESALGLHRAGTLAHATTGVFCLSMGEADLAADLGVSGEEGLLYARSHCVFASRLAGLKPPVQSVFTDLADLMGLRRSTELGRRLGFFGRSSIHPAQIETINSVFTPSAEELEQARALVGSVADANGEQVARTANGRFVDAAVIRSATRVLAVAERHGTASR